MAEIDKKTGAMMTAEESDMMSKIPNQSTGSMMTAEEKIILDSLMKSGISMDTALDIMASNKVDSMNKLQQLRGETEQPVKPQEFGGLPKMMAPTAPQASAMPNMKSAMSQQDMMNYLASKANSTKGAMGNILGAMGGASPMMQPQMRPTTGMAPTGMPQPMMPTPNPMMKR